MSKDNLMDTKFLRKITPFDADGEAGKVRFVLGNGQAVVIDVAQVPENIRERAMFHGFSQKIGDSVSGMAKDRKFGDAFAALQDNVAMLVNGQWNAGREGGSSDLVEALAKLKGLDLEDVRVAVKRMDEETLKRTLSHPAVKAEIARMRAERAKVAAKAAKASLDEIDLGI